MIFVQSVTWVCLFRQLCAVTFPCPPLQSCGPQGSCKEEGVCLQVGWRDCEGWEMSMESGDAAILSAVYAVFVTSPFASGRRDLLVAATTPTPCRNGSLGGKKKKKTQNKIIWGGKKCVLSFERSKTFFMFLSSFSIRHSNSKMRMTYTDWATVCGRMSLMPHCKPSFRLSEITSTGRLGAGSTSKSSSSSSSSNVILWYTNVIVFILKEHRACYMCSCNTCNHWDQNKPTVDF